MSLDLLGLSATRTAALIRAGDVSPLEVMDAHLGRIEHVNPRINAIVVPRFEEARAEARSATEHWKRTRDLPPLFGVPFTAKEYLAVAGMRNTGGMAPYASRRAAVDATVIRRTRGAGAILVGLTNGPEGGLWMEADNVIYGRTNNPWNLRRTPGGSSGGEGAIVAAGGVPFGLGSDIGGSVRIPAGMSGTVAHKSTARRIPTTGHFPSSEHLKAFLCVGPLCRRTEDLPLLHRILAGPDGLDHLTEARTLQDPDGVRASDLVVYRTDPEPDRLSSSIRAALDRCEAALVARGARAERLLLPEVTDGVLLWGASLSDAAVGESYSELLGGGVPVDLVRETVRWVRRRHRHTGPGLVLLVVEELLARFPGQRAELSTALARARATLHGALGPNAILLHPVYPTTAPYHYAALLRPFAAGCTTFLSICGVPATVVPVGFDDSGMPIGVQVAAGIDQDHLCMAASRWLEADFGGWVRADP